MIGRVNTGGGGTGAALTVTAPAGATVTVSKDGKSKTKVADTYGVTVFKGLSSGEWTLSITDGEQTAQKTVTITADYTTAITFFSATIHVTYPAGSTCTATDGVTILTAPDTSGTWDCVVPNAGTWTLGYNGHPIDSVEITTSGQAETISLGLYLFKAGEGVVMPIAYGNASAATVNVSSDKISVSYTTDSSATTYIRSETPIDLTSYTTLYARLKCTKKLANNYSGKLVARSNAFDVTGASSAAAASTALTNDSASTVYSADISSLTGDFYVGVHGVWAGELYDLWLE